MTTPQPDAPARATRAPRMNPADRRSSIVDAAIPLILEHGAEVTTRQIADAAGIAEGTVFRAFADKNELIDAAIERMMDPSEAVEALRVVDSALALPAKLHQIVSILHAQVSSAVTFMGALGPREHARHRAGLHARHRPMLGDASEVVEALLEPHREQIRIPIDAAISYIRVLVLGTSMPFLRDVEIDPESLSDFILRGIAAEGE